MGARWRLTKVLLAVAAALTITTTAANAIGPNTTPPPLRGLEAAAKALQTQADVPLLEAAACSSATPVPAGSETGTTQVTFTVPPVVQLQLDGNGAPVAAATNTGCAPRSTDTFVVGDRQATAAEIEASVAVFRAGDWRTPGTWVPAS